MAQAVWPGSFTQSPCPCDRPLLTHTYTGDSNTGLAQSLWGPWVLVCTRFFFFFFWALQASLAGIGFDSKSDIPPPNLLFLKLIILKPWNQKTLTPWKKSYDQPRQHIKKQWHYFANKGPSSQSYGFSSSHVWMWELDYKESWVPKNWCFWTAVLEKTLESP